MVREVRIDLPLDELHDLQRIARSIHIYSSRGGQEGYRKKPRPKKKKKAT